MKKFNKRGQSAAFSWIYGIVSLFGIGILFIIFTQVFDVYLSPIIIGQINSSTTIDDASKLASIGGINKYLTFWRILPFVLILCVIIYMIVSSVRKDTGNELL